MAYIAGQHYFICDRCGFRYRASDRRKEWTGLIVCPADLDPKPAQLEAPDIYPEGLPVTDPRPYPTDAEGNTTTRDDL